MTDEELDSFLDRKIAEIQEHCASVQILAERTEDDVCKSYFRGSGSWFARQGLVHEFLSQGKAQMNANELRKVMPQEPPDEQWKES